MVNSKVIVIYLFFTIIFNVLVGGLSLSNENSNIDLTSHLFISKTISSLAQGDSMLGKFLLVTLIPFLVIDLLVFIITLVTASFSIIPPLINIILFTPLGVIAVIDYVIPTIRGN